MWMPSLTMLPLVQASALRAINSDIVRRQFGSLKTFTTPGRVTIEIVEFETTRTKTTCNTATCWVCQTYALNAAGCKNGKQHISHILQTWVCSVSVLMLQHI